TTDGKLLRYFPEKRQQQFVYKEDKGYRFVQKTSAHPQELICYSSRELFSYDPVTRERRSLFYTEEDIQHVTYDRETQAFWLATKNGLIRLRENNDRIRNL